MPEHKTTENNNLNERTLAVSRMLQSFAGVLGTALIYWSFQAGEGSSFSRPACFGSSADMSTTTAIPPSPIISILLLSIPLWLGLLLSDVKTRKFRFWFYGFAGLYTALACRFVSEATRFLIVSDNCGVEPYKEIPLADAFVNGAFLVLISTGVMIALRCLPILLQRFVTREQFAGLVQALKRRLLTRSFGVAAFLFMAISVGGNNLYIAELDNRKTLQEATDVITLRLLADKRYRAMPDPVAELEQGALDRMSELYPDYDLVSVELDDERTLSVTLQAEMPLLPKLVWVRNYQASASGPIFRPYCKDLEGMDLDIPCDEYVKSSPIAG